MIIISEELKKNLIKSKDTINDEDYSALVDSVIQSGNLDIQDKYGFTILHHLVTSTCIIELISELTKLGANLNIQSKGIGRTVLMY
ncbi:MAG: hypothetical protein K2J20_04235, partial [Bacilli bacterium]|nr:hypothetical protein [Bacilli bacterium]